MGSEVVTFEEGVKNRLRGIVAELIPEDRYNALVQQELKVCAVRQSGIA